MLEVFTETFHTESKSIEYIQTRLRSAKDIFKHGGHVTMLFKDQQFRMHFDNKRLLISDSVISNSISISNSNSNSNSNPIDEILLDSKPLTSVSQGENLRFISKLPKVKQYQKYSNTGIVANKYSQNEDLVIKNFVKALLSTPPMFKLHRVGLENYKDIVAFIKGFKPNLKIDVNSIAVLKNRSLKRKSVPRTIHCEAFLQYLLLKFKDFEVDSFFRGY